MAVALRVVAILGGAFGVGLLSLAAVLVRLDRPSRLAPMPEAGAGNVHSRFAGPAVQESVWAAGAARGVTDLCNVELLSSERSFTFSHGQATSTAAFVVRLVGDGWASTEALPIELSLRGLANPAASRRSGRALRDTRREFVLQPLVGGFGGDEGVVPIIADPAATRGYSSWTARASVKDIKPKDCADPGKYSVEVLALQPSGSVVSLEFSWDKHVCALLMAFWAVVRVLASLKDAPSIIACDLYCAAYGLGVVAWTAVGLQVRWEHIWRAARLVTWLAALGDIALVVVVVLDCDGGFLASPFLSPRRSRGGELKKSDEVLETASPRNDKMPGSLAGGTMYPERVTLAAAAAASLLPLLWPCMPPGTFLCADGSDPRDVIREEIPVTARLLPLLLALPAFIRKWWCRRPGYNREIWLCEVSVLAFLSAPAISWLVPRLFPAVLHRKVQLIVSVLGCRTAGATGLVAWDAWYRSGVDGASAPWCRCASIVLALLVSVMVYWQAMAAVAAEPSHWVFPAAPLAQAPMSVEQFCAPVVAAVAAAAPPNATMPQVLHELQGTDKHDHSSSWAWNPNSTVGVAVDNFTGAMGRFPNLASVHLSMEGTAATGARREGFFCTAEAMRPLRSRIVQGEECGDQGWNQQFIFRAVPQPGNGTVKICVSEATAPPVRFQVLKGCTTEEGWLPRFSFYAMEKPGKGLTQLCVSKALNPVRWKLSFARTCNDRTFKQSFVFFVYDFVVAMSTKGSPGARGPAATTKLEAEKAELLRLARAEADALQALLSDIPLHVRQSHPLYNASLALRRKYFGQAYNVQVDPDGLKEKKNLMHSWNEEINARHRLHCQGWLQDRTESVVCPPPGHEEQVQPVNRSCKGQEATAPPEPFLRVNSLTDEFKTFCRSKDAGGPVWGELKEPKCANARQATQELLDKTHADTGPSNEAEAGFDNCPTCAVVGSSGNLLASGLGSEIDAHDVVMRINCAPTLGFSSDVGRRTTHRILYPEASWFAGEKDQPCEQLASLTGEGSSVIAVLFKPVDIEWWHHVVLRQPAPQAGFWHPVPRRMELAGTRVAVLAPSWMTRATRGFAHLLQGKNGTVKREGWPSSGMLALMLALQRCKSVNVYGFGLHFRNGSALGAGRHKYYVE